MCLGPVPLDVQISGTVQHPGVLGRVIGVFAELWMFYWLQTEGETMGASCATMILTKYS